MAKAEFYEDAANMGFVGGLFPDAKASSDKFLRLDADMAAKLRTVLSAVSVNRITTGDRVIADALLEALASPKDKLPKHAGEVAQGGEF